MLPPPIAPTVDDPVAAAASELVGGPVGRHARTGTSWWTPMRVALAVTLLACLLGYLQKAPCRDGWSGGQAYVHACYNDVYALYFAEGLADGRRPYLDAPVEYPVVLGGVMFATAQLVRGFPRDQRPARFFDVSWALLSAAALIVVATTVRLAGRRAWDGVLVAAAPGLVLGGFINWDLLATALTGLALLAWSRCRLGLAGAWLGLAISTKFYPILLLAPLLLLCVRARRLRAFATMAFATVITWVIVNVPIWLAAPAGWGHFFAFSRSRGADWGSLWYWLQALGIAPRDVASLNQAAVTSLVLLLAGLAVLTLRAPRPPRLPQVAFLAVAAFLLANKVWSPQFVIWLLPLAALARPRWRDVLAWQGAEVVYFLAIWLYLLDVTQPGAGLPRPLYFAALLLRAGAVAVLAGLVVRDIVFAERDPVRAIGEDDPTAGPLVEGAVGPPAACVEAPHRRGDDTDPT